MTLLLIYLGVALGVSFLCSLLEAALLSLPPSYVATLEERGRRSGKLLAWQKRNIDRPLAAILTLNTVAHTFGAAGVGAEATYLFGHAWVGVISVVVTILILFVSEIIPKTLGAVHAKGMAAFTGYTVMALIYGTYPLVVVCEWLSRLVSGGRRKDIVSREELLTMVRLGGEAGEVTPEEYRLLFNLFRLDEVAVGDVMTPRPVIFALPAGTTVGETLANHRPLRFARIPLYGRDVDDLVGMVYRADIFEAHADGRLAETLRQLARRIEAVPAVASVAQVFPQFLEKRQQLFQVVDEYGGTAGLLSLEDAVETLLGREIIGETDPAVDMRQLARRLFRKGRARRRAP